MLDALPVAPFDRITRLAAQWFDAPIALIALVGEDRQMVTSSYGLDEGKTLRDEPFCAHTILDDDVMVVEDATADERFADEPLVTGEPGIRFYAGAPLTTPDGYRIGALCVIDTTPHRIDDPDALAPLQDLAQITMDEIELRIADLHQADILESITDAFYALDRDWRFTYINGQAEWLLERSREELLGKIVWDEFPEAVDHPVYERYHHAVATQQEVAFELHYPPLDAWFRIKAFPFEGGLSVYFDDISERKAAERGFRHSLEQNRGILETTIDGYLLYDAGGRILDANPAYCAIVGYTRDELTGMNLADLEALMPAEVLHEELRRYAQDEHEAPGNKRFETKHRHNDGRLIDVEVSVGKLETEDSPRIHAFVRDITERKQTEEALREREERLRSINNHISEGIYRSTPEDGLVYVNDAFAELFGYDAPDDLLALDDLTRLYANPEARMTFVRKANENEHFRDEEVAFRRADGSTFVGLLSATATYDEDGRVLYRDGAVLDITGRKQAEEALREREEYLSVTLNSIGDAVIATDRDCRVTRMNRVAEQLTGYDNEDAQGQPVAKIFEIVNAHTREPAVNPVDQVLREGRIVGLANDTVLIAKDGTERQIADSAAPIRTDEGEMLGVVLVFRDVTEKYERRQALRRSKIALEQAQALAQTGNAVWDLERDTFVLSDEAGRLLGLEPGVDHPIAAFLRVIHPDDRPVLEAELSTLRNDGMHDLEYRVMPQGTNEVRWLQGRGQPILENGEAVRVLGTIADITEQKRQASVEQRFGRLLEGASSEIYIFDAETLKFEQVNRGARENLGYAEDELFTLTPLDLKPHDRASFEALLRPLRTGEEDVISFETTHRRADGTTYPVRVRLQLSRQETPPVFMGIVLDITEQKEAAAALRQSEARYRTLVEQSHDAIYIYRDNRLLFVNQRTRELTGYSEEELLTMDIFDLIHPDDREQVAGHARRRPEGAAPSRYEARLVRSDGSVRHGEFSVQAITYEGEYAAIGTVRDMTERKQAEEALRESEQRWRTLVESHPEPIHITVDGRYVYVNPSSARLFGVDAPDEMIGRSVLDLVSGDTKERIQARKEQLDRREATEPFEHRMVRLDGEARIVVARSVPITYKGQPAAQTVVRDVTEQRHAEQALRESEQRFRDVVQAAGEYVWEIDADARYTYVTEQAQQVKGRAPDALIGRTPYAFMPEPDAAAVRRVLSKAKADANEFTLEHRNVTPDGEIVWERVSGTPIFDDDDALIGFRGTGLNITEQKEARRTLERREAKVQALYEAMRALMLAPTRGEVAERIQTLIVATLRYPISAVRYLTDEDMLKPAAISAKTKELMPDRPDYARDGESLVARAFRRGGTTIHEDVHDEDTLYDRGAVRVVAYIPIGSYGIISIGSPDVGGVDRFDIKLVEILARNAEGVLERIEREDALREARDQAEEMNRLKSAFLANMSHEIRTPLTSIIGFAEVLAEQDLGEARRFTDLIRSGGQRLLETLNSVLDLSQLEAGSMRLTPRPIDVGHTVRSAADLFTPKAEKKGIVLRTDMPKDPVAATLDEAALHRILNNLLSNAVKFTGEGGRIDVRLDPQPTHLVLEIEDTGIGIDADFVDHLFEAFQQESSGDARAFEGSGLGLTITHRLVNLMGGDIAVATEKGEGTRFTVRLPYRIEP